MTATFVKVLLAATALLAPACGAAPDPTGRGDAEFNTLPPVAVPTVTAPAVTVPSATVPTVTAPPVGVIERAAVTAPGYVTVSGWIQTSEPNAGFAVTAWVDGVPVASVLADHADETTTIGTTESDFAFDLPLSAGDHVACVTPATAPDEPLDCIDLEVAPPAETVEDGTILLTAVRPDPTGSVDVRGVVTGSMAPDQVEITTRTDLMAATARVAVIDGGFRFELDGLADGTYRLCPTTTGITIDTDAVGESTTCGTAVIGALSVGTTGRAAGIEAVAPELDHPLHLMERDGGISVELGDGSTLWFFGDTMELRADGSMRYFVHNTAAWASAEAPTLTRDVAWNEPVLFAAPPAGTCDGSEFSKAALWPESAVAIPQDDGTDRVVVVMSKVCLGATWLDIETVGFAVAEYRYDPTDPPIDQPIRGDVTQPDLADADAGFGRALLLETDGFLYGYECGTYPDDWGPCRVARVRPEQVTDPGAWRYWNGNDWTAAASWVPDEDAAAAMELPGDAHTGLPVAAFGVTHHEGDDTQVLGDTHLMVYSPWPGFCGVLAVRASDTPVGPWTDAVEITFPNCSGRIAGLDEHCYAGTPQTQLCEPDMFAGGYYDMLTDVGAARYYTFITPFVVVHDDR